MSDDLPVVVVTEMEGLPDTVVARDPGVRSVSDPQMMRALAHPVRLALLEALLREGPLTATKAANLLDESPGNMSWHLQTLAKYGFVEETGTGRGRSRPWRLVSMGYSFSSGEEASADIASASEALQLSSYEQITARLQQWLSLRHSLGGEWSEAAFQTNVLAYLTVDELAQVGDEIVEIVLRYAERTLDKAKRPEGSMAVNLVALGHPLAPTSSGN